VAQVVEPDVGQPGTPEQRLERQGGDVVAPQWFTGGVREHEVVTCQAPSDGGGLIGLAIAVRAEHVEGRVG
jgi:hypothetical protein